MPPPPRLYDDLAWLWPRMSPPEDYREEAAIVRRLIGDALGPPAGRRSLLELGAGGGHTLVHLADDFDALAVDLSEPMLDNCRALCPTVDTRVGDMRTVRLGRTFDAVLIHDAIDYMTSEADARAALATARAHLTPATSPGGVAIIAPTYLRETFHNHELETDQHVDDELALSYVSYVHDPDPADDVFELLLIYLIKQPPDVPDVRIEHDRHTCGLFSRHQWLSFLRDAGFDATAHDTDAWSCFLARAV